MTLAMHMANELLTPGVAGLFFVITATMLSFASWRSRVDFEPDKVPLMGVVGAFVFAAQMINFPILLGTSGHLGGGVLLAILLGPHAATLVMASILIVQCLVFQDGGLLALGTNIVNMGIFPCYLGYTLFHLLAGARPGAGRLYAAVFSATLIGMVAGAALVPIEVWMSGRLTVPLADFLLVMVGLHLLVGLGEAVITFGVVAYITQVRPRLLGPVAEKLQAARGGLSAGVVLASLLITALLLGGIVSVWASAAPDALESITSANGGTEAQTYVRPISDGISSHVSESQNRMSPLPDYQVPGLSESMGTRISGVIGACITLLVVWAVGRLLRPQPRKPTATGTNGVA